MISMMMCISMADRVDVKTHLYFLGVIEEKHQDFINSFKKINKIVVNKLHETDLKLFIKFLENNKINYIIEEADENIEFAISADNKIGYVPYGSFKLADIPKVVWL